MADTGVPDGYRTIDDLIEAGDFDGARGKLSSSDEDETGYAVLRLKLGLRDGSLPPALVENRVVQLLRRDPHAAGARELFQEASAVAFRLGQSSLSHSHPPPPVKDNDDPES